MSESEVRNIISSHGIEGLMQLKDTAENAVLTLTGTYREEMLIILNECEVSIQKYKKDLIFIL